MLNIVIIVVFPVTELVKKWGNLRDRYVRLKKKGKAPSGSSADSSLKPEERKLVEKMNFLHSHIVERSRKTTENTVQRESGITSENPLDYTTTIFADTHDSTFLQSADNQESEFSQSAETSLQNSEGVVNIDGVFDFITPRKETFMANESSASSFHQNTTIPLPGTSKRKRTVSADSSDLNKILTDYFKQRGCKKNNTDSNLDQHDPDKYFLQSLLPHLKKVPDDLMLDCQLDILQTIKKYI